MSSFIFVLTFLVCANSQAFDYFDSKINYWEKSETKVTKTVEGPQEKTDVKKKKNEKPQFDWKKYMNPENKEFFKEGDYTPPEPFMEIARDPTDENLKNWFAYIDLKNKISTRLQEKMRAFLSKTQIKNPVIHQEIQKKVQSLPTSPIVAKNYRFRMYFDSTCPHCKRMFGTLKQLQEKGFYVEAMQVDKLPVDVGFEIPISPASPEDLKKFSSERVPLLLIADLSKKALLPPVRGYRSAAEILSILDQVSKN